MGRVLAEPLCHQKTQARSPTSVRDVRKALARADLGVHSQETLQVGKNSFSPGHASPCPTRGRRHITALTIRKPFMHHPEGASENPHLKKKKKKSTKCNYSGKSFIQSSVPSSPPGDDTEEKPRFLWRTWEKLQVKLTPGRAPEEPAIGETDQRVQCV